MGLGRHGGPAGGSGRAPALHSPLPTPLDSGLRRNDELGGSRSPSPQSSPIKGEEESRSVGVGTVYFHTIAHPGWHWHTKV